MPKTILAGDSGGSQKRTHVNNERSTQGKTKIYS
jgi:hypothetical protein